MKRAIDWLAALGLACFSGLALLADDSFSEHPESLSGAREFRAAAASQAFFTSTNLALFEIELSQQAYHQLGRSPKQYVTGKVAVFGRVYEKVGVRLKGAGTFQPINNRPNLTLKFNWQIPDQEFEGLNKVYLNNSRQDPTMLCEFLASEAYAAGGIPVPRITHARVRLNGRDLGLCVLAEAVNRRFLKQHFGSGEGQLYEGAFQDVRSAFDQDNGAPGDVSALKRLVDATLQSGRERRREALSGLLDVEQFLNFIAIEMIVANWDGYALNQNNYRIYHNPLSHRWSFIPHGMDNAIFESGLCLLPPKRSVLVSALIGTEEDQEAFRRRVAGLLPRVFEPEKLWLRVQAEVAKMTQMASPLERENIRTRAGLIHEHLLARERNLRDQLECRVPVTPVFDEGGIARLEGWLPRPDWNNCPVQTVPTNGTSLLSIRATNGFCFGSWRLPVWLPAGRYRLEGLTSTRHVDGLPSITGAGAGVRVLGGRRGGGVEGSEGWTSVQYDFRVTAGGEWVELIAELRAYTGSALFDPSRFKLVRLAPRPAQN